MDFTEPCSTRINAAVNIKQFQIKQQISDKVFWTSCPSDMNDGNDGKGVVQSQWGSSLSVGVPGTGSQGMITSHIRDPVRHSKMLRERAKRVEISRRETKGFENPSPYTTATMRMTLA